LPSIRPFNNIYEAHRGAFLWRHDVSAVFDNRVDNRNDPYFAALRKSFSEIPLLASTAGDIHPILMLYQTHLAHELHAAAWNVYGC
jgi:hypothetical protein